MVVYLSGAVLTAKKSGHHFPDQPESEHPALSPGSLPDYKPSFHQNPSLELAEGADTKLFGSFHSDSCENCKDRLVIEGTKTASRAKPSSQSDDHLTSHSKHLQRRKKKDGSQSVLFASDAEILRTPDSKDHMSSLRRLLFTFEADRNDTKHLRVTSVQELLLRKKRFKNSMERTANGQHNALDKTDSSILDTEGTLWDSLLDSLNGDSWSTLPGENEESLPQAENQRTAIGAKGFADVLKLHSALRRVKHSSHNSAQLIHSIWSDRPALNISTYLKMQAAMRLRIEMRRNSYTAFFALSSLLIFVLLMLFVLKGWKVQRKPGNPYDALEEPQMLFVNDVVQSRAQYLPMFRNTAIVDMVMVQNRGCDP